jgi:hypothetical protein
MQYDDQSHAGPPVVCPCPRLAKDRQPMPAETLAQAQDRAAEPDEAVPERRNFRLGELTTAELDRERRRMEAALRRPFSDDIRAGLRGRLEAVVAEQADRARVRREGIARAKADAAAKAAERERRGTAGGT